MGPDANAVLYSSDSPTKGGLYVEAENAKGHGRDGVANGERFRMGAPFTLRDFRYGEADLRHRHAGEGGLDQSSHRDCNGRQR